MKNLLPIQSTRRMAGLLLSAWLLMPGAWANPAPPRTNPPLAKNEASFALAGLVPSPASANSCVGSGVSTYVNVTGTGPFTFQWYRNQPTTAEPVSGKTSSSLSLYPLQLSDAGSYYLQVTGPNGVVWSEAFVLTVNPAMTATTPVLAASTICEGGSTTVSATFGGSATGGSFMASGFFSGTFSNYVTSGNTVTATFTSNDAGKTGITFYAYNPAMQCSATSAADTLTVKASVNDYSYFSTGTRTICQGESTGIEASFSGNPGSALFSDEGAGGTFSDVSWRYGNASATYTPAAGKTGTVSFRFSTPVPGETGECVAPAHEYQGLSINEKPTASATTLGAATVCSSGSTSVSATFGGSATSGSFSDGGAGGSFTVTTTNKTVSGTYTPASNFSGEVTITFTTNDPDGPCGAATSTATLTVSPAATAGSLTSSGGTLCQGEDTYVYASFGGSASSGSFSDGGAGGTFSNTYTNGQKLVTANYKPASGVSGEVTITFTTNDPDGLCPAATSTATLTINPAATVTTPTLGASTVCQGGTTTVSATYGGGASELTFSDDGAGGAFTNVSTSGNTVTATYTPANGFSGEVTITARTDNPNGPCPDVASAGVKLTVSPAATASAPVLGASTLCQGSATTVSATFGGSATGGTFSDGGAGGAFTNVSTNGSTVTATYTPPGTFTGAIFLVFTTTGPCPAVATDPNQAKLTVNAAATLSDVTTLTDLGYTAAFCRGGLTVVTATFGGAATGGTFSDGGVGGQFTNVLLLGPNQKTKQATYMPPSEFTGPITITFTTHDPDGPCPALSATLGLTVNPAPTATTPTLGTSTICQGSGSTTVNATFGGSATSGSFSDGGAGGAFSNVSTSNKTVSATYTPASSYSGSVTITFTTNDPDGTGSCVAASSTVGLTVNAAATASAVSLGSTTLCQGGSTSVSASFGGGASSGAFSDGGKGGSFNVTTTNGVVAGTYTPAANFSGEVTMTFTTNDPSGPCGAASSSATLTINPAATASTPTLGASVICQGTSTTVSAGFGGGASSGSFSDGGKGGAFSNVSTTGNTVTATYTPAAGYSGEVTLTFTTNDPDGPCGAASSTVLLTVNPAATATAPTPGVAAFCQGGSTTVSASFGGSATSGSFSDGGKGGSFNVTTTSGVVSGTYTPAAGYSGQVTMTFTTNDPDGPCGAVSSTVSLTVKPLPAVSLSALAAAYCQNASALTPATPAGGTYRVDGGNAVGSFNPSTLAVGPHSVEYAYTDPATGCSNTASQSVEIIQPIFTQGASVSGGPVCAGQAVTLAFGVNCTANASFTAQLSDASGSFANPVSLGNVVSGSQAVVIPPNTPFGTGYRLRVVGTNPTLTSTPSEAFRVNALGQVAVAAPTTPGAGCPGETLAVSFSTTGSCPFPLANAFTVQLSSATGNFANPTVLGVATVGTTHLTLPATLLAGSGYRVRILSSLPAQTWASSAPFQVAGPSLSVTPTVGGAPVCQGSGATIGFSLPGGSCSFPEGNAFTAQLSSATGSFNNPTSLGTVVPGPNPVTIPASVLAGSGYRIRVVSSSPALTSANSAPFQVKTCPNRLSAEEPGLVVVPNPVSGGEIRVRVTGMDSPHFGLTTATGQAVGVEEKTDGSGEFVLTPKQRLAPGVYLLQASGRRSTEGTARLTTRVLVAE